ncbi:hypothetical protein LUZ63_000292 [Rhynchospora breviuscula]|uniref:LETM1-like protein n=1 Tax=Rhynchospora breviuscula TaxID=2022672 RepID=A0A9Q0HWQ9_9POAL|nr:hypothetical protein LUZ63_000292 [Rhynchospora breviuscula]
MATASQPRLSLTSTSKVYSPPYNPFGVKFLSSRGFFDTNHQNYYPCYASTSNGCTLCWFEWKRSKPLTKKHRRLTRGVARASSDDGLTVNGAPQASSSSAVEQMRIKLDQVLENDDFSNGIVQSIYDAARAIELAFLEHSSVPKSFWFSRTWLGADKYAWIKSFSYQAAIDSLLQAAIEISSRGDGRDRDINVFVQRSLSRLRNPLEAEIQDQISRKQPGAYEWYLSNRNPLVVSTFVNFFEKDIRFSAATAICGKQEPASSPYSSEVSLLMLSLSCLAAITKLGPAKVSCQTFFSMIPEAIGRCMDKLLDFVPISEAYQSLKDIGLRREFLFHFGPRAAIVRSLDDQNFLCEIKFWIDLTQSMLQRAISREKIWSRLTTCESIEVLEKDLAIFGFFIALGRSTQSYLSSNGFTIADDSLGDIIRYLIGGSVLYYPQLSSISSYQLYVEVVGEELEWLPFYGSDNSSKVIPHGSNEKVEAPKEVKLRILAICFFWMTSFTTHSLWLENPSNVKAASFLSRGEAMLSDCMKELGVTKDWLSSSIEQQIQMEPQGKFSVKLNLDSIDEALESVETALVRLESLLQELHVSDSDPGNKEQLQAACSDLERIRRLKKQAEFLEASFRAKAWFFQTVDADVAEQANKAAESKSRYFWGFLVRSSARKAESGDPSKNVATTKADNEGPETTNIHRIEKLTTELMELEKRVRRTTEDSQSYEDDRRNNEASSSKDQLLPASSKKDNIITKSVEKLKETTTDVLQGTQLLATDVAAATELLRRSVTGDELTEKEKKALQRTLTDLASVIPIGILMLLPVTAVGHAAILAFIQRYVPALIPSTYAPERLDLLRQLEKVKEMETSDDVNTVKE